MDCEHLFDGYKRDPDYAVRCVKAAYDAGARWVVLCDTNGGTLPDDVRRIVDALVEVVPGTHLGIHCHNDTENSGGQFARGGRRRRADGAGHDQRAGRALRQHQPRRHPAEPGAEAGL